MSFDPPARLTISYEPPPANVDVDEGKSQVAYFEAAKSTWARLDAMVDLDSHCVTAAIDHLGTFIVSFDVSFDWYAPPVS
jgi:hypothetical protein